MKLQGFGFSFLFISVNCFEAIHIHTTKPNNAAFNKLVKQGNS